MNEAGKMNPKNADALLGVVAKKLGTDPEKLKREFESGCFDSALKGLKPDEAQKLNRALADPKIAEQLLSAPQAQALYRKLRGEK